MFKHKSSNKNQSSEPSVSLLEYLINIFLNRCKMRIPYQFGNNSLVGKFAHSRARHRLELGAKLFNIHHKFNFKKGANYY